MAKTKRLALSLSDESDQALSRLSELTSRPKSSIISELIDDAIPFIEQVIKAIQDAKIGKTQAAIETTAKFLNEAQMSLNQSKIDFDELKGKHGK